MARHPDSFPTIGGFPIFQVSRNPNSIILFVIIIVIIRGIRSVIVITNWGRRGYQNNRRPDEDPKVGMASMVSTPGRSWSSCQKKNQKYYTDEEYLRLKVLTCMLPAI